MSTCRLVGERVNYWSLAEINVVHVSTHHHLVFLVIVVCLFVYNKQSRLVWHGLDTLYHLLVILRADVRPVYFNNTISGAQFGRHGWRVRVNCAYELPRLPPLSVQVKTVASKVRPLA